MGTSRWLVAAAGIAVTVGGGPIAVASDDEVVLGMTVPLTGAHKRSGTDTHNGFELAIPRINEPGGVDVALRRAITTTTPTGRGPKG